MGLKMKLHSSLINVLACPVTKDKLIYDEEAEELISLKAGLSFPIMDGIPIMLESEARKVDPKRLEKLKKAHEVLA